MSFLKDCNQCQFYRGGFCSYYSRNVLTSAEAQMCPQYSVVGIVTLSQIGNLAGQIKAIQIPDGLISTLKLNDLCVTSAKLANDSVTLIKILNGVITDAKIDAGAAIAESKLNLDFSTASLDADIQTRLLAATYLAHNHSPADPTQVDHENLLNVLTSQHHVRYADTEAVAAIEAEPTIHLSGRLGIGKVPSYAIDLQGVNAIDVSLNSQRFVDSSYGIAWYMKKARGTVAVPLIVSNNDNLFELLAYGYDGSAFRAATSIKFLVGGVPGASDMPGVIHLCTTPDGGISPTTALSVYANQNVGLAQNLQLAAGKTVDGVDVSEEPARITAEIATHAANPDAHHSHSGSGELASSAWGCVIPFLSDGAHTTQGSWELTADGTIYFNLETMLPRSLPAGTIRIDNIYIYFETNDNACYLNASYVYKVKLDTKDLTSIHLDSSDTGNGATGDHTRTIALNYTRQSGYGLTASFNVEATTGTFNFHGIKVEYTVL